MTPVDENTSGREEARQAVAQSRRSSRQADSLIADTRATLERVREVRDENHFTSKFRDIIRGSLA